MNLPRRQFLHIASVAAALPAVSRFANAQAYPARPVRLISPFPAGGPNDIVARLVGQWLSERLGQPFIIENRVGAGGNIGTEAAVKASPDGYTLLVVGVVNTINASVYDKLSFDFIRDIAPVASVMRLPIVMVVNPLIPAKTVPDFVAYAKANPGKLNMASGGNGTASHVAGELFKMMADVDLVHVPYRGAAPAVIDLLSGQMHVMFDIISTSIEHIRAGKLQPLAVTTTTRSDALPEVPTVGDFVLGYEASAWFGIGAPKDTAAEIVNKLNGEINAGLADPKIRARLAALGGGAFATSPHDFGKFIGDDIEKWAKVVRFSGAKPG
jgi:tripartite-type tricarboxylate transporter receptor subunit TctC